MTTGAQFTFTDRYGGRPPSWLRGCFGECEATGYYPVKAHPADPPKPEDVVTSYADVAVHKLTERELLVVKGRIARGERQPDGWYFLLCPKCGGTGRVPWLVTLARIPRWLWRGVRNMWEFRPSSAIWTGHHTSWWRRAWLGFKVSFLCDLGWRL